MKKYLPWMMIPICLLTTNVQAAQVPLQFTPLTPTIIQSYANGTATVKYQVTNKLLRSYSFSMVAMPNVTQVTSDGYCSSHFTLGSQESCTLTLRINRSNLASFNGGPKICIDNGVNTGSFMCSTPKTEDLLTIAALSPTFPYGTQPSGNVCIGAPDQYATPESMLGSWAMLNAVQLDQNSGVLPPFLNGQVAYGVGTAALGDVLGISNCSGGCNQLNGYCFALKFNGKSSYPYLIFQSVNTGANQNSFDIYMAGGGSGAFPASCAEFWGTTTINWANHIEDSSCTGYFGDYSDINSTYSVNYCTTDDTSNCQHTAKQTLMDACTEASVGYLGFNTDNWTNITVVPVTCPQSLTQITGLNLANQTVVGNHAIIDISSLTEASFTGSDLTGITSTQMQDCKTPSSGYCDNITAPGGATINYESSISASLTAPITAPILQGQQPYSGYCSANPGGSFCGFSNTTSNTDPNAYCNQNAQQCLNDCHSDPPYSQNWCTCNGTQVGGCQAAMLGGAIFLTY